MVLNILKRGTKGRWVPEIRDINPKFSTSPSLIAVGKAYPELESQAVSFPWAVAPETAVHTID